MESDNSSFQPSIVPELNITTVDTSDDNDQHIFNMEQAALKTIFWLEGVLMPVVGIPGLFGNIVTSLTLRKQELDLKPIFRVLVTSLLAWDSICLVLTILIFSVPRLSVYYDMYLMPRLIPHLLPLAQISLTASIYTTMAVAMERFICVCRPHTRVPARIGAILTLSIFLFSVFINGARFFEYELKEICTQRSSSLSNGTVSVTNVSILVPFPTEMRRHPMYSQVSTVMSMLLLHLVPLVSLSYLNCAIFMAIRARRHLINSSGQQKREMVVATVLTVIVLVFLLCHSLKFFINFVELWAVIQNLSPQSVWGPRMSIVVSISHALITINCSVNFIIYCCKDKRFRDVIWTTLVTAFKSSREQSIALIQIGSKEGNNEVLDNPIIIPEQEKQLNWLASRAYTIMMFTTTAEITIDPQTTSDDLV